MPNFKIAIKGAGDLASGIISRLYKANIRNIYMMENKSPKAVRRGASFTDAIFSGKVNINGIFGVLVNSLHGIDQILNQGKIPIIVDPFWKSIKKIKPHILIDAIIAKKNIGTNIDDADIVLGIGPGFIAGCDVDFVIETKRGHELGKIISNGQTQKNTFSPELVNNFSFKRVLKSPIDGFLKANCEIGDVVKTGDIVATVENCAVISCITGVVRGLIKSEIFVKKGTKIADVDPRGNFFYCDSVSDKAMSIGGAVLEIIVSSMFNYS